MQTSATNLHPVNKNKFINLLNSYVPTNERSWNYAIPIFGLSLSCFSFGIFLACLDDLKYPTRLDTTMYNCGFLVLASAAGIELYYGLTHRSRRQYTFWILLKIIEVVLVSIGIVMKFIQSWRKEVDLYVSAIVIIVLNCLMLGYVIKRSTRPQRKTIENIYEVPHAQQYVNVSVY